MDRKNPLNGGAFPTQNGGSTREGSQPNAEQWNADVMELSNVVEGSGQTLQPQSGANTGSDGKSWKQTIDNQQLMIALLSLRLGDEFRSDPVGQQRMSFFDLESTQRSEKFLRVFATEYVKEYDDGNSLTSEYGRLEFTKDEYPNFHRILSSWKAAQRFASLRIFYDRQKNASERHSILGEPDSEGRRISMRYIVDNNTVKTGSITPHMGRVGSVLNRHYNEVITEIPVARAVLGAEGSLAEAMRTMIPDDPIYMVRNILYENQDYAQPGNTRVYNPKGELIAESANLIKDEARLPVNTEKIFVKTNWLTYVDAVEFCEQLGLLDLSTNPSGGALAFNNPEDVLMVKQATFPLWIEVAKTTRKRMNLKQEVAL